MFLVCGPFLHFPAHLCRLCLHRHFSYVLCCSHIYSASSFRTSVVTFRDNPRGSPHFKIFHSPTRTEPLCYVRNSSRFWGLGCWHCGATLWLTSMSKQMTFLSGGGSKEHAPQGSSILQTGKEDQSFTWCWPSSTAAPTPLFSLLGDSRSFPQSQKHPLTPFPDIQCLPYPAVLFSSYLIKPCICQRVA